jgi:formamidopyrimidine-DNA glycosylase
MPELPEVEVLVRHLSPLLNGKTVRDVLVRRSRVLAPTSESELVNALKGATFVGLGRRGKYLLLKLRREKTRDSLTLVGHLGMTGRMYLSPKSSPLPKHAAVVLDLGQERFIFEDTRYFGKLTLDMSGVDKLGPEALGSEFTASFLAAALKRSAQSIKVKLLDQSLVAGVGNIYASEALFRAGISPRVAAQKLTSGQVKSLHRAIREVLARAIRIGSSVTLDFAGNAGEKDGLFYYGSAGNSADFHQERFLVYDREGKSCLECGQAIRRMVQGARSTFYCRRCQRA